MTELLTEGQAAELLGISEHTLSNWRSARPNAALPFVRMGRLVRYRRDDLQRYIDRCVVEAAPPGSPATRRRVAAVQRGR